MRITLREAIKGSEFELILGALSLAALALLLIPVDFQTSAQRTFSFALGPNTNEGLFSGAVVLLVLVACAAQLLRRWRIPAVLLIVFACLLLIAAFEVADLWADLSGTGTTQICPTDPVAYFEPDLYDHFGSGISQRLIDEEAACVTVTSFNPVPAVWFVLFALSVLTPAAAVWRARWQFRHRVAGAVFASVAAGALAYVISAVTAFQHLE
jgi:hypothetical protein